MQAIVEARKILSVYLDDAQPQVRIAAIAGLRRRGDATLQQRVVALLDDPDAPVRAAALAAVLGDPGAPEYARARQDWEAMLASEDRVAQRAALSIIPNVSEASLQGRLHRA